MLYLNKLKTIQKIPHKRVHFGDEFVDNYEWMRNRDDQDVMNFLNVHNNKTEHELEGLEPLRKRLFDELDSRILQTDISVPSKSDGYWYYMRTVTGNDYGINCRIKAEINGDQEDLLPPKLFKETDDPRLPYEVIIPDNEQIFFDKNHESKRLNAKFFSVGSLNISEDDTKLLYSYDLDGDERYTLRVRDFEAWKDGGAKIEDQYKYELDDIIEDTAPGAIFNLTGKYIFYTRFDDSWRSYQIWRHKVGEKDSANDALVFEENDPQFNCSLSLTGDKRYYLINTSSKDSDELWLLPANNPTGKFSLIKKRTPNVEFAMAFYSEYGYYFVIHNEEHIDFDIDIYKYNINGDTNDILNAEYIGRFLSSVDDPNTMKSAYACGGADKINLKEYSPRQVGGIALNHNFILVSYCENMLGLGFILKVDDFLNDPLHPQKYWTKLAPKGSNTDRLYQISVSSDEYNSEAINWSYQSYTTPLKLYFRDLRQGIDGEDILLKELKVLPNPEGQLFDASVYTSKQIFATAADGEQVPLTLVWRKDKVTRTDGESGLPVDSPCLLYSYGSYGSSLGVGFSVKRLSFLDRGIVMAYAHIRGGSEKGRNWYYNGRGLHKMNTFTDYIQCAKHLIDSNITKPAKLVANGGSAGGLLMGAVLNMAPELFAGIEADVPFVDPLTTMMMPELPLTTAEWEEWGNPLVDEEVYRYMKSYSPYENISPANKHQSTPKVYITTSLNDTRVLYVEPAKWAAKLGENGYDVLLRTEMDAGHGGTTGRYNVWRECAYNDAWIIDMLTA